MSADTELPRRARASKHWRWRPGMRYRVEASVRSSLNGRTARIADAHSTGPRPWALPDLDDPPTQGCILAIIAERTGSMSDTLADIAHRMRRGATLPQALVEALESCP